MRKSLLESFDKIYILDLHGNAKKKEVCADGSVDQNVFDIMQGVSINIFVKTGIKKKKELGKAFHFELQGKREFKYEQLNQLKKIPWQSLELTKPNYFFVPKNFDEIENYTKGFKIDELFSLTSNGIEVGRERVAQAFTQKELIEISDDIEKLEPSNFQSKYDIKDSRDWVFELFKKDFFSSKREIEPLQVKPFDYRFTYFTGTSRGFHTYPAITVNKHVFKKDNFVLITTNQAAKGFKHVFITKGLSSRPILDNSGLFGTGRLFPLYLYPEATAQQTLDQSTKRTVNFNREIIDKIAKNLNLCFVDDDDLMVDLAEGFSGTLYPLEVLDYIYAVLHSPAYREKYKAFLKIDFPRVPYPKDLTGFRNLSGLGSQLRQLHLLENQKVENYITEYPIDGSNVVSNLKYIPITKNAVTDSYQGNVFINETQYFANLPLTAWKFYIGGYQPAQKWLKDRKGRTLEFEDILHYQKIIVALTETDKLMKEIDKVGVE